MLSLIEPAKRRGDCFRCRALSCDDLFNLWPNLGDFRGVGSGINKAHAPPGKQAVAAIDLDENTHRHVAVIILDALH